MATKRVAGGKGAGRKAAGRETAHDNASAAPNRDHGAPAGGHGVLEGGLFFSRDESWLRFDERVLEEAEDEANPLLERVKFLAITASNLDEFVEIRVAGILQRIEDGFDQTLGPDEGGLTPPERLNAAERDRWLGL